MTKRNKSYKFCVYLTEEQAYLMRKTFGVYVSSIIEY
ncbi:helix-turn-helix domain-containing protein [Bacillus cereus]